MGGNGSHCAGGDSMGRLKLNSLFELIQKYFVTYLPGVKKVQSQHDKSIQKSTFNVFGLCAGARGRQASKIDF